jgi:hypothetical protein
MNMFLDNVSCNDVFMSSMSRKEKPSSSTSSLISVDSSSCQVRVLNNYYKLLKRSLMFDNITVQNISGPALYNTLSDVQGYMLTVSGNLAAFALSRPLFISFGPYGAYGIRHFTQAGSINKNIFTNFSSEGSQLYNIFIYQLNSPDQFANYRMQPSKFDAAVPLTQLYRQNGNNNQFHKFPITIYYLNFYRPIVSYVMSTNIDYLNTLTLVMSKEYMQSYNKQAHVASRSIELNLEASRSTSTDVSFIHSIEVKFNLTSTNADDVFYVVMTSNNVRQTFRPHSGFLTKVASLRGPNSKTNHNFHIVVSTSFDAVTIVAFLQTKDSENVMDTCYMTREQTRLQSRDMILSYKGSVIDSSSESASIQSIVKEMKKYASMLTTSSIPNYAYLAKALGYYI